MWLGSKGVLLEIHTYEQGSRGSCSKFWVWRVIGIIPGRQGGKEIKAMTQGKLPGAEMMRSMNITTFKYLKGYCAE